MITSICRQIAAEIDQLDLTDHVSCSDERIENMLESLLTASRYPPIAQGMLSGSTWFRGRILGAGERVTDHMCEFKYAPWGKTEYQRLTQPGGRDFYAAWNVPTMLHEIQPQPGSRVLVTQCLVRDDQFVCGFLIGAYEHFFMTSRTWYPSPPIEQHLVGVSMTFKRDHYKAIVFTDSYLASLLRNTGAAKYRVTSALAKLMRLKSPHPPTLIYPSVWTGQSLNVVMEDWVFDWCFEVPAVEEILVERYYGHHSYDLRNVRMSTQIAADGQIDWTQRSPPRATWHSKGGLRWALDAPRWRCPLSERTLPPARICFKHPTDLMWVGLREGRGQPHPPGAR